MSRQINLADNDTCIIIRPMPEERGFKTIVYSAFTDDYPADDRIFYHVMARGICEVLVSETQAIIDVGVQSIGAPSTVRPVDEAGNIIEFPREEVE